MEKKIPKKNYITLLLLSVITIITTFSLMNKYKYKFFEKRVSFVLEIKENELHDYITEGHEVIIYMSNSKNKKLNNLEKDLEKYTIDKGLKDEYLYLDLSQVNNKFYDDFYITYLNESYNGNFKITDPTLVLINDGKIRDYLNNIENIEQIEKFFTNSGVFE